MAWKPRKEKLKADGLSGKQVNTHPEAGKMRGWDPWDPWDGFTGTQR